MDIQCPSCQRKLSIGDQYAGQLVKCPACNGVFSAPSLAPPMSSPAAPAPTPPPPQPQAPIGFSGDPVKLPSTLSAPPPPPPAPPPPAIFEEEPSGPPGSFGTSHRLELCPETLRWVGPVAVSLIFVLSFFPWVIDFGRATVAPTPPPNAESTNENPGAPASHPAEPIVRVTSFNLWEIAFGASGSGLWIVYILFTLFLALPLAWVKLLMEMNLIPKLDFLRPFWIWRAVAVGGFLAFVFLFALLGWFTYTPTQVSAMGLYLGFLAHFVAIAAFALEYWLAIRKKQNLPLPELTVRW